MLPEYKAYEHAMAVADVMLGWIYGIAAVGLILDESWGYKLIWILGAIMVYHSLSYWLWHWHQNRFGHPTATITIRILWVLLNSAIGILAILIAS